MKKNYSFLKTFFALFTLFALKAGAQISGVVTINSAFATSGTNYQTFTALATVLNTSGINGPLTVNVVANSGPYNEQVNFNQTPGISSTNTITINGNNCILQFNATLSTAPHTLMFTGADYITVNNLNIYGLGATYALAGHLWSGADNNTFVGCTFSVSINTTGTSQVPFSISGSGTSATSSGNAGSNNTVLSSTISGGYYNTVMYGNSAAPFNVNNKVQNSYLVDYYVYGCYNVYCQGTIMKGNVIERMNRTTSSTCYGIYFSTGSINSCLIEGNHIRRLYNVIPASTNATYCIYVITVSSQGNENIIRNNIVSDINTNGSIYGIYLPSAGYTQVYHNTLSFDDQTATAGLVYAIYLPSTTNTSVRNNIVTVSRAGSGTKYCIYASSNSNMNINNNVYYLNTTTGTYAVGFSTAAFATLNAWQIGSGYDLNSISADPVYTSTATLNYAPTSLVVNNAAFPVGVTTDFYNTGRSMATPDPGAIEFYTVSCASAPSANSVVSPTTSFCPGQTVAINVANTYTNAGYSYQWVTSTVSVVGPFTSISGATLANYVTAPLVQNVYYTAIITCTAVNSSINATSGYITVAGTTTNSVPYSEGFESLAPNRLPNCSWSGSNMGGTTLTQTVSNNGGRIPRNGTNFATFYNSPALTNYFYTNGILLKAGVTYSASLWYITDLFGSTNWTDLSIMLGTTQSVNGLVTIASTNGPANSPNYKSLSNTFTVATTGLYYVAVRGTGTPGNAQYLSWDDLLIEIPCTINNPYLAVNANYTAACVGTPLGMSASGADTYTWSTGSNSSTVNVIPSASTTAYYVSGTSTLSGCVKTVTQSVSVNPAPPVAIFANNVNACAGKPTTLTAIGAGIYNWSTGSTSTVIVVSPTANTSYSVIGVNATGCTSMAVIQLTVNPLPNVVAAANTNQLCAGENLVLTGIGATSYQWSANPNSIQFGNPITVSPQSSVIYTVTGTDTKGCTNVATIVLEVNDCVGLNELDKNTGVKVYPNPNTGLFAVDLGSAVNRTVQLLDVTGKVITTENTSSDKISFNISTLARGIYFVKAISSGDVKVVKVVKQD